MRAEGRAILARLRRVFIGIILVDLSLCHLNVLVYVLKYKILTILTYKKAITIYQWPESTMIVPPLN